MKAVLQRVSSASVAIEGAVVGEIGCGVMLLLGVSATDTAAECDYLAEKVVNLRIFEDEDGKMNRNLMDSGGEMLVVSQFTLYADCKKGRRPSYIKAARPEVAIPLYERFIARISVQGIGVATGRFGANMQVALVNDGPVTILLDTDEMCGSQL